MIDWTQIVTPQDVAAEAKAAVRKAAKAKCRRRIHVAASQNTQINLASAAAAGMLTVQDMESYRVFMVWIAAMRAAWRVLVETDVDLTRDASWPAVPSEVARFAGRF